MSHINFLMIWFGLWCHPTYNTFTNLWTHCDHSHHFLSVPQPWRPMAEPCRPMTKALTTAGSVPFAWAAAMILRSPRSRTVAGGICGKMHSGDGSGWVMCLLGWGGYVDKIIWWWLLLFLLLLFWVFWLWWSWWWWWWWWCGADAGGLGGRGLNPLTPLEKDEYDPCYIL